ncbi:hypothetical protein CASFOL_000495 [Castilleja foliolosa]|uniref:Tudor domain-containing protein n=1 Tax=Castilleja foliolosa TaxID=1961234 RepID=A0ABD3EPE7_9LAMI
MLPLSDKELEERLSAAGNSLLHHPSSPDELLPLLDQIEELLQKVEQSPARSMQTALSPLTKALVAEELLKHSDVDVKVGVASCISEITRITAPDAPYDDDKMKDVFQLIVSSFENLSDTSSRSYEKRATILETVAKVRSCVIMLDLECDQMINVMFQHFLTAIRVNHANVIFASMETIMTLVLEESEDISPDLLNPILVTLKMNNEAVMPIAKKLAERVIQNSADRLRPYLADVVKSLDASLDDYGEVVASVCRENTDIVGNSNESISRDEPVVEKKSTSVSPARDELTQVAVDGREETNSQEKEDPTLIGSSKSIVSNGIKTEKVMTDANSSKKANSNHQVAAKPMPKTESDDCGSQNPEKLEAKAGYLEAQEVADNHEVRAEVVLTSPTEADKSFEAAESFDKIEDTTTQLSPSHAPEILATNVASPSQSGILCDESPSEKDRPAKRKEDLVREEMVSVGTASKKASEGESISKAKNQKGKMRSDETTDKDKVLTEEGSSKNDDGNTSDSEARSLHQTENLGDVASKKSSKGETISKVKKQHDEDNASDSEAKSLHQTEKLGDAPSGKASKGEGISKIKKQQHDEDNTSDSEAKLLSQMRKLGNAASKKASKGGSTSKAKKQQQKGKKRSDETTDKYKALTEEGVAKNDEDNASDSEASSLKQTIKLADVASKKTSKGESTSKANKQQQKGKKRSDETNNKDKSLTEEGASKNEGSISDSEERLLNLTEKPGTAASKKAFKVESIPKLKKQQQKGKKRSEETTNKDKELTEGATKNAEDNTSDSEARSLKHTDKLGAATSKKASKGGNISKAKKKQLKGKKQSDNAPDMDKALTEEGAAKNDEGSKSDSEARSLDHTYDLGDASNKMEDGSFMTKEDGKKSASVKPTLGKDALKSSAREVHAKVKVTSPRSPLKSLKDEDIQEETPRMSSKRKRTPGTEKVSDSIEYDENLVGSKVKVWWPKDRMFYEGEIASFDSAKKKHKVMYVDGDEEVLNLKRQRWKFLGEALVSDGDDVDVEHSSHDTSPDVQRKKKGNANAETSKSKRQKMDGSSKSKQKDAATKSGGKLKDDGKLESEMKEDNSKPSRKSVDDDDDTVKPRDHFQKVGGKSQGGGKSKDDSAKTPSQQSKLDIQKNSKSKGKTPESGKSIGAKTTKTSSLSKVKETDQKEKKVADLDSTKSRESESKSVGKKRRR